MILPFLDNFQLGAERGRIASRCWDKARAEVLAKFPGIVIDSSGWHRALQGRYRRILAQALRRGEQR